MVSNVGKKLAIYTLHCMYLLTVYIHFLKSVEFKALVFYRMAVLGFLKFQLDFFSKDKRFTAVRDGQH